MAYYHCISRVVDRRFVLGDLEREQFIAWMRHCEAFCGVRVITYCVMSNHFHILLEVPQRPAELPSDEVLFGLLERGYSRGFAQTIRQRLEILPEDERQALRESFFNRMWDVSAFMKLLKQRFTQWFNKQQGRKGTLWEERFKSVLVDGVGEAMATMAAYIDLNPVRAGLVGDPKTKTKGQVISQKSLARKLPSTHLPLMRQARLKAPEHHPVAYYHCISRVVDRRFVLGDVEREQFVAWMRHYEAFCGVRIITYCVMSNHFHILVEVPQRPETLPTDEVLLGLLERGYSKGFAQTMRQRLEMLPEDERQALRESFFNRMWDVSAFMKLLKQRFTQWFNKQQGRKGTLWEERFKSVLVDGVGEAMATMAAYIDLNPVRAGLVDDPKDYRWCGYAEAVAGKRVARQGLRTVITAAQRAEATLDESLDQYRVWLFGQGEQEGIKQPGQAPTVRRGLDPERVQEVVAKKGKLPLVEYLRCRVRYFADGAVLGTRAYVDEVFQRNRERFGPKRKDGARKLRHLDANGLFSLRDLRLSPVSVG